MLILISILWYLACVCLVFYVSVKLASNTIIKFGKEVPLIIAGFWPILVPMIILGSVFNFIFERIGKSKWLTNLIILIRSKEEIT